MSTRDSFSGRLSVVPLSELLLKLKADKKTGVVSFQTDAGEAKLWQKEGILLDAQMGRLTGARALDRLLGLQEGSFRFENAKVDRPRVVHETLQELLSRRSERQAEWGRLTRQLPSLGVALEVDEAALASQRKELNSQQGSLLKLVDGQRTIAELVELSDADPIETLRMLLEWRQAGVLRTGGFTQAPVTRRQHGSSGQGGSGVERGPNSDPPIPATVRQYSSEMEQVDAVSSNPPPAVADRQSMQTRLGVPSVSSNPPPNGNNRARSQAGQRGGLGQTKIGGTGISSNPPGFGGATRPGFSIPRPPQTPLGSSRPHAVVSNTTTRGGMHQLQVRELTTITTHGEPIFAGGASTRIGLPAVETSAPPRVASAPAPVDDPPPDSESSPPTVALNRDGDGDDGSAVPQLARLGRYEILARLGRGGMGSVYLARLRADGGFRRFFAVKVLRADLSADAQATRMLRTEARIASLLHHPNIVAVVDVGTEKGQPYLVMDYVRGCSLARLLKAPRGATPERIATIMLDCLSGLSALHQLADESGRPLGAVHNDISPENLMVGVDGVTRLSDFGVALIAGERPEAVTRGKVEYLSPERARGQVPGQRSDVFAAGIMLWNALTGEALFRGDTPEGTLKNVVHARVTRPSEVGRKPPPCFDSICLRALAKDPADRYATVEEMLSQLRRVAISNDLLATPGSVGTWAKEIAGDDVEPEQLAQRRSSARATSDEEQQSGEKLISRVERGEAPPSTRDGEGATTAAITPTKARSGLVLRWVAVLTALTLLILSAMGLLTLEPTVEEVMLPAEIPALPPSTVLPNTATPLDYAAPPPPPIEEIEEIEGAADVGPNAAPDSEGEKEMAEDTAQTAQQADEAAAKARQARLWRAWRARRAAQAARARKEASSASAAAGGSRALPAAGLSATEKSEPKERPTASAQVKPVPSTSLPDSPPPPVEVLF